MAKLTLLQAVANPKIRPVLLAWSKRTLLDDQIEFLLDYNAKKPAKYLYETYIKDGAHNVLNLAPSIMKPVRELAKQPLDAGFKTMGKPLAVLFDAQLKWLEPNFDGKGGANAFVSSPEYETYLSKTSGVSPAVRAVASLKLSAAKAKQLEGLLQVYLQARTPGDAWQAYVAMQKIAPKAKLDPALTTAGKPAAGVERDYKVSKLVETLKPAVAEALRYFDSALKSVQKDGLPHDPIEVNRMFQSGRMRAEKVTTPYTQAILLDRAFNSKFSTLAAEKNKVDTQWAAYRIALSKK